MRLGLNLIYQPNLVTSRSLPKNKKHDDFIFQTVFSDHLQITPDIFEEKVIGNLG